MLTVSVTVWSLLFLHWVFALHIFRLMPSSYCGTGLLAQFISFPNMWNGFSAVCYLDGFL